MKLSLKTGVSVLICTYNGVKLISETLKYLERQKFKKEIPWEIIIVDNASSDGTWNRLEDLTAKIREAVPVKLIFEAQKGKHNAVDTGLKTSKYKYVIICDDDNWLLDDYVENAFNIMEANPSVGLLGGKGVVATDGILPPWFEIYKSYFAIGDQHHFNGEVQHFWPKYQFIWGAGSVINKTAYNILISSGFKRILNYKDTREVSRSEDLELCFAIWLTGYKLWFDDRLKYSHFISQDRLTSDYFIKIVKISAPAIYYLKPYNIIKFTGATFAPSRSFWMRNIKNYFCVIIDRTRWKSDIHLIVKVLGGETVITPSYVNKLITMGQFLASVKLLYKYERNYKRVLELQKSIDAQLSKASEAYGK